MAASNPGRQLLLDHAQAKIAASDEPLPVRCFIAIDPDDCTPGLSAQRFLACTREGAIVAYGDWMDANATMRSWPDEEFYYEIVADMFDGQHAYNNNSHFLIEVPMEYEDHRAPDLPPLAKPARND